MGLLVYVYRTREMDCTNGGISSKAERLCLVNVSGPFHPGTDAPAALLIRNTNAGKDAKAVKIVPARMVDGEWQPVGRGMFGGNFASTSDSRFAEALRDIAGDWFACCAVPIHDRFE
jgi:hypothetical protein